MRFLNGNGEGVQHIEREDVRLCELAGTEGVIEGLHFTDCQITGPAVLVVQGDFSLVNSEILGNPDAYLWEIPPNRSRVVGAILVKDCKFERCTFKNVGWAGPPEFIERVRQSVEIHAVT